MSPRPEVRVLWPFACQLAGAGGWLVAGWLLGCATLIGSLGLLGLSGGFLAATAIAGLTPAAIASFNFFLPGAGVRFFALLRTASRWGERVVTHEGTFRLIADLRGRLFRRLAPLSPRQLGRHHGGDLLNRLVRDVDALDNLYPRLLLPACTALTVLGGLAMVVAMLAPAVLGPALVLLLAVPLLPVLGWHLGARLAPALVAQRAELRRALLDSSEGLADLLLHRPAWTLQRAGVLAASERWLGLQLRFARRVAWLRAGVSLWAGLCAWAALGVAAGAAGGSGLDGAWLAGVVVVLLGGNEVLQALPAACVELPGTAAATARVQALAGQQPVPVFVQQGAQPADASLCLRGVAFSWDGNTPVFDGLDLAIDAGEHVALLGPSGGGKSTLVQLLTRLEDPDRGAIALGGVAYPELDERTLRRHVACASQFGWAQRATLADNLRLADPAAADARLHEALEVVGLADCVAQWPDGLGTWVEEGGASLSGGQRRRLGVARALLRAAPVTILDEPSEGLDEAAEIELVARLRRHLAGRSLLWITHRERAVTAFDRCLHLDGGVIRELRLHG